VPPGCERAIDTVFQFTQVGTLLDDEAPEREQSPEAVAAARLVHVATSLEGGFWLSSAQVGPATLSLKIVYLCWCL
jgi:hypothetical protein